MTKYYCALALEEWLSALAVPCVGKLALLSIIFKRVLTRVFTLAVPLQCQSSFLDFGTNESPVSGFCSTQGKWVLWRNGVRLGGPSVHFFPGHQSLFAIGEREYGESLASLTSGFLPG